MGADWGGRGGARAAWAAGIDPAASRRMGRWSSGVYALYVRMAKPAAAGFSVAIGSTVFDDIERRAFTNEELVFPGEFGDFDLDEDEGFMRGEDEA